MAHESSPGDLARIYCSRCKQIAFFTFKGGPISIPCPTCDHLIRIEVVHDGRRWRMKDMQTGRRILKTPDA
jgi:hypothetical protein